MTGQMTMDHSASSKQLLQLEHQQRGGLQGGEGRRGGVSVVGGSWLMRSMVNIQSRLIVPIAARNTASSNWGSREAVTGDSGGRAEDCCLSHPIGVRRKNIAFADCGHHCWHGYQ